MSTIDNVYVNISFVKNPKNDSASIPLIYNVDKNRIIVNDPENYYATVVKFDIPLSSIPVCIMPIVPNQAPDDTNPNLSTLQIGIQNGEGTQFMANLEYDATEPFPVPVQNDITQVITPYYFIYSYTRMIGFINEALLVANFLAFASLDNAPYFVYNSETGLISLIVPAKFNVDGGPLIIFNEPMFQYLDAFVTSSVAPFNNTVDDIFKFNIFGVVNESYGYVPTGNLPPTPTASTDPPTPPAWYKLTQEYQSVQAWSPIRKILFETNLIPINTEFTPPINNTLNNSGVANSQSILTDFTPQINKPGDSRSTAFYSPSGIGNFRLVDLLSSSPLTKIDMTLKWQDIANNVFQLIIPSFQQANIKIAFIRKDLYKNKK